MVRPNSVISRLLVIGSLVWAGSALAADVSLLNVSYDPTRELYQAYNQLFEKHYAELTGAPIHVTQSHGGSGKQAIEHKC